MRQANSLILPALLLGLCVAQAGPPLVTDDPDTPKRGDWEINVAVTADKRGRDWSLETPLLDFNYGFRDTVQLKFELPYLVEMEKDGPDQSGIGNSELGVKWRFFENDAIAISTYPQLAFNSSDHTVRRGLVDGGVEFVLPVEFSHEFTEETEVFGELGGAWTDDGDSGAFCGLAMEHEVSESFAVLAELFGQSAHGFENPELLLNVGFHWQACEHVALIGAIGRGLIEGDEPMAELSSYLGLQFTF
ncbi:hypothetical protein [Haloferula sp. BvORR071]|uniref:hypothetical protein n=1 Tax=Haloferula sp. BvORR071 TaxID=1396141 RepID=UPI000696D4E9|nr:hypothetical protein [Haloferula sp. BvORR071]